MIYKLVNMLDRKFVFDRAKAHCDIPCGIYDPSTAQIAALTVVRMMDLMADLEGKGSDNGTSYHNSMARYIDVKEEHAEIAKHEVRVIWGDYLKAQHELEDAKHKYETLNNHFLSYRKSCDLLKIEFEKLGRYGGGV